MGTLHLRFVPPFHVPRRWSRFIPATALTVTFGYVVVRAMAAMSRGLDLSDESLAIVTYRYYGHPDLLHTGAGAFFGPIFSLVGWSVPRLRFVKLVLLVSTGWLLGSSVVGWARRRLIPLDQVEAYSLRLLIAMGSFTAYTWTPQTPSYNDLAAMTVTVSAAGLFSLAGGTNRPRAWLVALGVVFAISILNKWPTAFVTGIVIGVHLLFADAWREIGRRRAAALLGVGVAGCLTFLYLVGAFPHRYVIAVSQLAQSNSGNGRLTETYLSSYWSTVRHTASFTLRQYGLPLIAVLAIAVAAARTSSRRLANALWMACFVAYLAVLRLADRHGVFAGGSINLALIARSLPLLFVAGAATVAAATAHRVARLGFRSGKGSPVLPASITLLALWLAPAAGTDNSVLAVAHVAGSIAFAFVAVALLAAAACERRLMIAALPLVVICAALAVSAVANGLWEHPYRLQGQLAEQSTPIRGVPLLRGLSVDTDTAKLLEKLSRMSQREHLEGNSGFSSFATPGTAIALGLKQPLAGMWVRAQGYVGYQPLYDDRLRLACENGLVDPTLPPVIIALDDAPMPAIGPLLEACGIDFANYRVRSIDSPGLPMVPKGKITVWIPISANEAT